MRMRLLAAALCAACFSVPADAQDIDLIVDAPVTETTYTCVMALARCSSVSSETTFPLQIYFMAPTVWEPGEIVESYSDTYPEIYSEWWGLASYDVIYVAADHAGNHLFEVTNLDFDAYNNRYPCPGGGDCTYSEVTATNETIRLYDPSAVPELATWAMMLVGFCAIGFALRRRPTATPSQAPDWRPNPHHS